MEQNMELLEKILDKENLNEAYKHVKANKGAPGVDGVTVDEAYENITQNKEKWLHQIRKRTYKPQPVRRVQIQQHQQVQHLKQHMDLIQML